MATEATHPSLLGHGTVLAAVSERLAAAALRHRDDELPPVALLIADADGSWALVAAELHQVGIGAYVLGEFDPDRGFGPAIWLRMVADTCAGERPPILVLPGVRAGELKPPGSREDLKPLIDVAARGQVFTNRSGHEMRLVEFLVDERDGLGLSLETEHGEAKALQGALAALMDAPLADLRHRVLRASDLRALVLGHDPQRRLLEWLADPHCPWVANAGPDEWQAFRSQCREEWGFDPDTDGPLSATELLARGEGTWDQVWSRFEEAAGRYAGVVERVRQLGEPAGTPRERLPSVNTRMERDLSQSLCDLADASPADARARVESMDVEHGSRRNWLWRKIGEAPLATALAELARIASADQPRCASVSELVDWWTSTGYAVDDAAMDALAACVGDDDRAAVVVALRAIYGPWLDDLARHFQDLVMQGGPPAETPTPASVPDGTCLVFVDGLRGDLGWRLARLLAAAGEVSISWRVAPLPTITPTGKPASLPVALQVRAGMNFELTGTDGSALSAAALRRSLKEAGWTIVDPASPDPATARGWCELGSASLDELGHQAADRFAERIPALLDDIVRTVRRLISAGWKQVRVVTDHGFLYLPGGFAKAELPQHLAAARKPRCARLIDGADRQILEAPWAWALDERIAFPRGTAVFELGSVYEHGGISVQEAVVPAIHVVAGELRRPS